MFEVIAEQSGTAENDLKAALCELFEKLGTVERAYLAYVKHDLPPTPAPEGAVALCLFLRRGAQSDRTIAHCITTFRRMFSRETSLDIIPISAKKDAVISEFCRPFFGSG